MRTNIVIDDALMQEAQSVLGAKTKRETVEEALRRVIETQHKHAAQMERQKEVLSLWGIGWEGDLDAMRTD